MCKYSNITLLEYEGKKHGVPGADDFGATVYIGTLTGVTETTENKRHQFTTIYF